MNSEHIFRVWSLQRTLGNKQENHLYVWHSNPSPLCPHAPTCKLRCTGVKAGKGLLFKGQHVGLFIYILTTWFKTCLIKGLSMPPCYSPLFLNITTLRCGGVESPPTTLRKYLIITSYMQNPAAEINLPSK